MAFLNSFTRLRHHPIIQGGLGTAKCHRPTGLQSVMHSVLSEWLPLGILLIFPPICTNGVSAYFSLFQPPVLKRNALEKMSHSRT